MQKNPKIPFDRVAWIFKDQGKKYKIVEDVKINNSKVKLTSEQAYFFMVNEILQIKSIGIQRKPFIYDPDINLKKILHLYIFHNRNSAVMSTLTSDSDLSIDNIEKRRIGNKLKIDIDKNCSLKFRFAKEQIPNQQLIVLLKFIYKFLFYDNYTNTLHNLDNLLISLFDNTRSKIFEYAQQLLESISSIRPIQEQTDIEKWVSLEMDSALLETIILPIRKVSHLSLNTCLLEHLERCNSCYFRKNSVNGKEIKNQDNCNCKIITNCDVIYPKYRQLIWEKHIEGSIDIKHIKQMVSTIYSLEIPKNLNLPFALNKMVDHSNYDLNKDKLSWALERFPENEYYRTVLFVNYIISISMEGKTVPEHIIFINDLWLKIRKDMRNFVIEYLKLWTSNEDRNNPNLEMNPDWLLGWFTVEILNSKTYESFTGKSSLFSPEENILFHKHLSILSLYILFWIRKHGDTKKHLFSDTKYGYQSVLEAILFLLCEYAYIDGELTRQASLYRTLLYMWSHQSILYTLRDSYRDHLHHVIEVCLIGLCLIKNSKESSQNISNNLPWLPNNTPKTIRNWIVTSLFHDVGYGVEILRLPLNHLSFFEAELVIEFRKKMMDTLNNYEIEFGQKNCQKLRDMIPGIRIPSKNLNKFDHGVISALNIASLIDFKGKKWLDDMTPAIEAAALHNCKTSTIDQTKMPLAFLLFLCDHLQEWDRPYVEGEQMRYSLLVNLVRMDRHTQNHGVSLVQSLKCSGFRLNENGKLVICSNHPCFTIEFSPVKGERYYPPLAWVGHGRDFQKIVNCKYPVTVKLRHPVKKDPKEYGSPLEMDLFQHFLRESGKSAPGTVSKESGKREVGNSVLRQWVAKARLRDGWFRYNPITIDDDNEIKIEEIEFKLHEVDQEIHIPALPNKLVKHFISWRKRYRAGLHEPAGLNSFDII